jgi:hypothetical protein
MTKDENKLVTGYSGLKALAKMTCDKGFMEQVSFSQKPLGLLRRENW